MIGNMFVKTAFLQYTTWVMASENSIQEKEAPAKTTEHVWLNWMAPERPYKKRGIRYYFNIALIAVITILVLLFFYQYILIGVVFSLVFVGLVMATVPARYITYQISDNGRCIGAYRYSWEQLKAFWQSKILGHQVFIILTTITLPKQVVLMPTSDQQEAIKKLIAEHIPLQAPPEPTWLDKRADDLVKLVNLGQRD